jgi:hypothetical protein
MKSFWAAVFALSMLAILAPLVGIIAPIALFGPGAIKPVRQFYDANTFWMAPATGVMILALVAAYAALYRIDTEPKP